MKVDALVKSHVQEDKINGQIVRYAIAGVISNGVGYLLYLIATMFFGLGHKTAMTGLYSVGMAVSFYINRKWTFRGTGTIRRSAVRFFITMVMGYAINFLLLFVFVDLFGFAHQLIQAVAIALMAVYFFLLNKWYVHA